MTDLKIFAAISMTSILAMVSSALHLQADSNGFDLICNTKSISGDIPIIKYVSKRTGLHIIIAQVEGPLVHGFFTLATEAEDDDGLPHTLEHLAFLGSENYPYKGVLDLLANRCLARGTNAWTDVAHTAYTVETAGPDGFLNLLPIYLDHLLYPTLTDAGFTTEVYHVTEAGEDAGVVYSEMQARENTGDSLTYNSLMRSIYPDPSGYRYETGGIMSNLRESITNEKIKSFHKKVYRPENLHVIIAGQVEPHDVFKAIMPIEEKIISKGDRGPYTRPWESPVPPFNKSEEIDLVYPSDVENTGIVRVAWRGPSLVTDIDEFHSVEVLMEYLTDLSVSPLSMVFVENDDPLASEVSEYMLENSISACILTFKGVPVDKINLIKPLLDETLVKIANETIKFDLQIMKNTLNNLILKEQSKLETSPHDSLALNLIVDILFGHTCEDMEKHVNRKVWLEKLLLQPTSYWLNLLTKYTIDAPSSVVKGFPSVTEALRIQETEKARVEDRKIKLGEEGLKNLGNEIEKAKAINEIPPPDEMLQSIPVPSVSSINFHSLKAYSNIDNVMPFPVDKPMPSIINMKDIPVKLQLDDIKSNFVEIIAVLDTSSLNSTQKEYLQILMDLLLESPILKDNIIIPYEEVVKNLNADTIKAETLQGLSLWESLFKFEQYFTYVGINLKVKMAKYKQGIEWLKGILFNVVFDAERVKVKTSKLINSIGEKKRSGSHLLTLMHNDVKFKEDTNINKINVLRQETFLNKLMEELKTDPTKILEDLREVYKSITNIDTMVIHMATNLEKLASVTDFGLTKPWLDFTPDKNRTSDFSLHPVPDSNFCNVFTENSTTTGYITGVGSVESAYLLQTTKGITNYSHEDLPPLMTAISYLTQLEGPMWKEIRGKGLAYNYGIEVVTSEGTLTFKLTRAAQLTEAYKAAMKIFDYYLNGTSSWDQLLFESARSSLIYTVISRESEISDVVQQSLLAYYRQVPHDYNRSFLNAIAKVTLKDINRVANKYFRPMIDAHHSQTVIVCPPNKVTEVQTELNRLGHNLEIVTNIENSRFSTRN